MLGGFAVKLGMSRQFPLKEGLGSTFDSYPALTVAYPSGLLLVTPHFSYFFTFSYPSPLLGYVVSLESLLALSAC